MGGLIKKAVAEYFRTHTFFPKPAGTLRPAGAPAMTLDLEAARNRQWSNPAKVTLAGAPASLCGQFSRGRKAYFGVLADGDRVPAFFSADDLVDSKARLAAGGRAYAVSLAADLLDPLGSKLQFREESGAEPPKSVTLRRMLEVAYASGELAVAGEPLYRVFFGQDVEDTAPPRPGRAESFAFILRRRDDYTTYLVARELVPTDGSCALFPLHRGQPVCLGLSGGRLRLHLP